MTNQQWELLLSVLDGAEIDPLPVGFIIDSPWLPGWAGMSVLDYYASETRWFDANVKAIRRFPSVMFLPGFWSEWGMCTEPSAFGTKCVWHENELPFSEHLTSDLGELARIKVPNPRSDGLPPFMLRRLTHAREQIAAEGHAVKFAVARGPLNIAAFLAGNTEFLLGLKTQPDESHALLDKITQFLVDWIQVQKGAVPEIEGIFLLDDIVGFIGPDDFREFAEPYLKRAFEAIDAKVRFFHNDARGDICAPRLAGIGINLFNFAFEHSMSDMRKWLGDDVTLLGNIPPRDVLAQGSPDDVRQSVREMLDGIDDRRRVILSCGGGVPPNVSTENMEAFLEAAGHGADVVK